MDKNIYPKVKWDNLEGLAPIFIVGTPKSGTTFLMSLFNSHPACLTLFETAAYFFPTKPAEDTASFVKRGDQFFLETDKYSHIHPAVSREKFLEFLTAICNLAIKASAPKKIIYAFLAAALARRPRRMPAITHFVEKRPDHYRYAAEIFRDFPRAKIIHTIRDPRDNYLALKRMMYDESVATFRRPDYHPTRFLRDRLIASFKSAYENKARFGDRYRIVFYEDLIQGGEAAVRELAFWLGLAWSDAMLTPTVGHEVWKGNSLSLDLKGQLKPFDPRPIGRWRGKISHRELEVVEYLIQSFKLEGRYPVKQVRSRWTFLGSLILPFRDELRLEWRGLASQKSALSRLLELSRGYVWRRYWIYSRLTAAAFRPDIRFDAPRSHVESIEA